MRYEQLTVGKLKNDPYSGTHTRFITWPALASLTGGTDTTPVAGTRYYAKLFIPHSCTLTGIGYLIGSVGGTDKAIVELHDANGVLVARSDSAGTTVGTSATMQEIAFTQTYNVEGPAYFWVAVTVNGTTCRLRTMAAATAMASVQQTGSATGTFGTDAAITPPTTFTADKGPIAYTY